jgi:hypothetical protein
MVAQGGDERQDLNSYVAPAKAGAQCRRAGGFSRTRLFCERGWTPLDPRIRGDDSMGWR